MLFKSPSLKNENFLNNVLLSLCGRQTSFTGTKVSFINVDITLIIMSWKSAEACSVLRKIHL